MPHSLQKPGGRRAFAQEPLTKHNLRLHQELKKMDYFALRMGEVRFRGWEIAANLPADADNHNITAADLRPSLQQKGVDMRIGLDIASLTLKEALNESILDLSRRLAPDAALPPRPGGRPSRGRLHGCRR